MELMKSPPGPDHEHVFKEKGDVLKCECGIATTQEGVLWLEQKQSPLRK